MRSLFARNKKGVRAAARRPSPKAEVRATGSKTGRPRKVRLEWYKEYPDAWDDARFRVPRERYGFLSYVIYKSLNDLAFQTTGYYVGYGSDRERSDVIWKLRERLAGKGEPRPETIGEVIDELVACEFYDRDLYQRGFITSAYIQECFYTGTSKRKGIQVEPELWLLDESRMRELSACSILLSQLFSSAESPVSDAETPVSDGNKSTEERKGEEIREDKSRVDERTGDENALSLVETRFKNRFAMDTDAGFRTVVCDLLAQGKPVEQLLAAIDEAAQKHRRNPAKNAISYTIAVMRQYQPPAGGQSAEDAPLTAWELESAEQYKRWRAEKAQRQEEGATDGT